MLLLLLSIDQAVSGANLAPYVPATGFSQHISGTGVIQIIGELHCTEFSSRHAARSAQPQWSVNHYVEVYGAPPPPFPLPPRR